MSYRNEKKVSIKWNIMTHTVNIMKEGDAINQHNVDERIQTRKR